MESQSLIFIGLKIPRDYVSSREENYMRIRLKNTLLTHTKERTNTRYPTN